MGDTWLIVLPTDPLAVPPQERREAAVKLLQELLPEAEELKLRVSEEPGFFDCGSNSESIFCPFCGTEIEKWWMQQMDRWWNDDRNSLAVETPCCGRATSLNDLDYVWPQGFACVAVEVMNPQTDLEPAQVAQVEEALDLPVRLIWRYI